MPPQVQHFPAEYFSGADVTIYLGDTYIEHVTSIEFSLIEQARPIFGYQSYVADAIVHGNRTVIGSFRIPFVKPRYLLSLVEQRSGRTLVLPKTAPLETAPASTLVSFPVLRLGDQRNEVRTLQRLLRQMGAVVGPMASPWPSVIPLQQGAEGEDVDLLHRRLRDLYVPSSSVLVGARYTSQTADAVRWVQGVSGLVPSGVVDHSTAQLLRQGLQESGIFDVQTRAAIIELQVASGLTPTGELDEATQQVLPLDQASLTPAQRQELIERYWGEAMQSRRRIARHSPFFPDLDLTIYFSYGSREFAGGRPTIRALLGVNFTAVQQIVDNSGRPVEEQYTFTALDVDDGE